VIPNGIDTEKYRPVSKSYARELLGFPKDKVLLLFGAYKSTTDKRKGYQYLKSALSLLKKTGLASDVELVIFGTSKPNTPEDIDFPINYTGYLHDEISKVLLYSSTDIFIAPSVQDNLPNTVMEAMACGVPCMAFDVGGLPDMIDHKKNGYLAAPFDPSGLVDGISWIISDQDRWNQLSKNAREKVEQTFSVEIVSREMEKLYKSVA